MTKEGGDTTRFHFVFCLFFGYVFFGGGRGRLKAFRLLFSILYIFPPRVNLFFVLPLLFFSISSFFFLLGVSFFCRSRPVHASEREMMQQ